MNMTHDSPRARRHALTRDRILQAAIEQIGSGGPAAVTLASLAEAVDLTPTALYRYFASKEAILREVGLEVAGRWAAELAEVSLRVPAHADPAVRALARVLAIAAAWRDGILTDPVRSRVIGRVAGDPGALLPDAVAAALVAPALDALAPLVLALADAPLDAGDPLERAITLLAAQQGLLALAKLGRLTPVIDGPRLAEGIPALLLRGWGAPDAALAAARS